ncbi:acetate--CoA ligase family protein [Streptomyces spongiae]|nr:acetate--CoA ligase family protein [Streptomyces spongiae]
MQQEISAPANVGPIARLLNPRSVAILGMSAKPGSTSRHLLRGLVRDGFPGDIYLVGRSGGEIDGQGVLTSVDDLPRGVDLALITVPADGVRAAVEACVRRGVGTGIVYASGFAEFGDAGRAEQAEIARLAREGGLRLAGPNCIGNTNYVDRLSTVFLPQPATKQLPKGTTGALAVLAQSGGLMGLMTRGLETRGLPISYRISTGNEAGLTLADYLDHLADDPATGGFVVYAEDIRDPQGFLRAVRKVRSRGKPIVLTHAGRSERGQQAAASHTGALAVDYGVMRTLVTRAGACVVESLDELLDVAEILARHPQPPTAGIGVATTSGAFCALALDTLGPLGADVPNLSPHTVQALTERMPAYMKPANPLDLGTTVGPDPELYRDTLAALLADGRVGSVLLAVPFIDPASNQIMLEQVTRAASGQPKPVVTTLFADVAPLPDDFRSYAIEHGMVVSTSPERMMRAMTTVTEYGRSLARVGGDGADSELPYALPELTPGPQTEWLGKKFVTAVGVPVPDGELATTVEEAVAIAAKVGYPVAAKAQAADLQHKTEAGGLVLGIKDEAWLRAAWTQLTERVATAAVTDFDGILVEAMASKGVELMVGAKRHPTWGPVVMVGLGGVWVEAIGDVRLIPPDLSEPEIVQELRSLRSAKLLGEFRGSPAADLAAVARIVAQIGRLTMARDDIVELDINPLLAAPDGATALDVLIVCAPENESIRQVVSEA